MDRDGVEVHKHANKELDQYPAILTSHLVNKGFVTNIIPHSSKRLEENQTQPNDILVILQEMSQCLEMSRPKSATHIETLLGLNSNKRRGLETAT